MRVAAVRIRNARRFYAAESAVSTTERVRRWTSVVLAVGLAVGSQSKPVSYVRGQSQEDLEITRAESLFMGKSLAEVNLALARLRPEPVSESDKAVLLKDLSPIIRNRNESGQLRKLQARLANTLKLYGRDRIVDLIVIRHPEPIVISKPGVVLVFSTEVLKIVGADDSALIGVAAHELAHEYVAQEFLKALQSGNLSRMRELELFCDAVAVVILLDQGLDPSRYAKAVQRIATYTEAAAELNNGKNSHPAVDARLRIISNTAALFRE